MSFRLPLTPSVRVAIYEQFEQLAELVPTTPEYAYLDLVRTNSWAGNLSLNEARRVLKEWREARKNPAAVALGKTKSKKKAAAARRNGKKGGRPKKKK